VIRHVNVIVIYTVRLRGYKITGAMTLPSPCRRWLTADCYVCLWCRDLLPRCNDLYLMSQSVMTTHRPAAVSVLL